MLRGGLAGPLAGLAVAVVMSLPAAAVATEASQQVQIFGTPFACWLHSMGGLTNFSALSAEEVLITPDYVLSRKEKCVLPRNVTLIGVPMIATCYLYDDGHPRRTRYVFLKRTSDPVDGVLLSYESGGAATFAGLCPPH